MAQSDWVDDPTDEEGWVDDDQLLASPKKPKTSKLESGLRGAAQGASFGFADEITGLVETALDSLKNAKFDKSANPYTKERQERQKAINEKYQQLRDESRKNYADAKKDNPGAYTTTEIAGALVSPVNKIGKGLSLAKQGAIAAGIAGAGNSEAEDLKGLAIDTGTSAMLGGGAGKLLQKVTPVFDKSGKYLGEKSKDLAEKFAARALGAERGTIKKLGEKKVKDAGRQALDEGLLTPLSNTDDVISKNEAMKAKGAGKMNEVYKAIDDAGESTFNPEKVAQKVEDELGGFYRSPINKGEANQLDNTLESIKMRWDVSKHEGAIKLSEAQKLKEELGKVANWKNNLNLTDKEKMARDAYKIVSQAIDEAAEKGAKAINKNGLDDVLKEGKQLYSRAKTSEELLTNKQAREQGNNFMSLTDWIMTGAGGGAGLVSGDPETVAGTAAMLFTKKGLQKYGPQSAALVFNKVSKSLLKDPKMAQMAQSDPIAFRAAVQSAASKMHINEALPMAAEKQEASAPLKGKEKWANDGAEKLKAHGMKDSALLEQLKKSPYGKELLMRASDLAPGSPAMEKLFSEIKKLTGGRKDG